MNDAVPQPGSAQQPLPRAEHPGAPAEEATPRAVPEYAPAAPAPLNVPRTPTGNAEVDARVERLADADHLATDGHVEVYEDVHRGLRDALTALDARPGPPVPTRHPTAAPQRGPSGHESDPTYRQGS
ncbi:hypothetical protein OHB56_09925 [Streptomyces sp. NBC_01635]|uniref:hypothetical protein n=1 Tax=Streptomyces sp. NBC_01635 TaxID=2975904 RepID=UPI003865F508|nr:hypothetical protein OHB56_09925 [Streptomyces sp. NBC_01635]